MKRMRLHRGTLLALVLVGIIALLTVSVLAQTDEAIPGEPASPDAGNLRAFIELARSDIRTEKSFVLAQNMIFTEDEAVEFWPLQREYEFELSVLYDGRLALIREFIKTYDTMTEDQATQLAENSLSLEESRTKLKRAYFSKFAEVITAKKAVRFFQIENQINTAIDFQIAVSLPLIK